MMNVVSYKWLLIFSISLFIANTLCADQTIHVFIENLVPINYVSKNGNLSGVAGEKMLKLKEVSNYPMIFHYNIPWLRCIDAIENQRFLGNNLSGPVAVLSMARINSREKKYKWVGPIFQLQVSIYGKQQVGNIAHSDSSHISENIRIFKKKKLKIVTPDYHSAPYTLLVENGYSEHLIFPITEQDKRLLKLDSGQVDLMIITEPAFSFFTKRLTELKKIPVYICTFELIPLYIAFSLNTPDSVISHLQFKLEQLKD